MVRFVVTPGVSEGVVGCVLTDEVICFDVVCLWTGRGASATLDAGCAVVEVSGTYASIVEGPAPNQKSRSFTKTAASAASNSTSASRSLPDCGFPLPAEPGELAVRFGLSSNMFFETWESGKTPT